MEKVLIGYKRCDDTYVYVGQIDKYNISVTTVMEKAIDFKTKEIAQTVCEYLGVEEKYHTYLPIKVTINLEEVSE